jgi:hypothetical protein
VSRRLIGAGAALTVIGLALAMVAPLSVGKGAGVARIEQLAGGLVVLVGWLSLAWGIHRFGREA